MKTTKRMAHITRETKETRISIQLSLDGTGKSSIKTNLHFMDHMLELLARHAQIDMNIRAKGDMKVDYHHTVEDIGLTLGTAIDKALGERVNITRFGFSLVPMDEALAQVAIDLGGRPFLVYQVKTKKQKIRDFDLGLIEEFFRAFVTQGRCNLHIALLYGKDPHHCYEAIFKAVACALKNAVAISPKKIGIPSTKGCI
jgi:imidazoleglycerol-phosphate dehydratase